MVASYVAIWWCTVVDELPVTFAVVWWHPLCQYVECSVDVLERSMCCGAVAVVCCTNSPSLACVFCFVRYVHQWPAFTRNMSRVSVFLFYVQCSSFVLRWPEWRDSLPVLIEFISLVKFVDDFTVVSSIGVRNLVQHNEHDYERSLQCWASAYCISYYCNFVALWHGRVR